jgi:hypothetical protein
MMSGDAMTAQMAICVRSSSSVMHELPMSSMSASCQCPGPAKGASDGPYCPQWSMIECRLPQSH